MTDKAKIIPEKILEEVRLRKHFQEQGIQVIVSRKRQWGGTLANSLINNTDDAEIVEDKQLPLSSTIN